MRSCSESASSSSAPTSTSSHTRAFEVEWRGCVPYRDALALQLDLQTAVRTGETRDRLLLLEHPPVITLGRSSRREHILSSRDELTRAGVELIEVARGGDVTYHAPGQLVGYLIADLRTGAEGTPDVIAFLRAIERTLVRALDSCGVPATTLGGMTGVFVDRMGSKRPNGPERKLASIGIGVRAWVSMHGFALNVSNPIDGFRHIVPCGLEHVRMTSVAEELGATAEIDARVRAAVSYAFQHCFG